MLEPGHASKSRFLRFVPLAVYIEFLHCLGCAISYYKRLGKTICPCLALTPESSEVIALAGRRHEAPTNPLNNCSRTFACNRGIDSFSLSGVSLAGARACPSACNRGCKRYGRNSAAHRFRSAACHILPGHKSSLPPGFARRGEAVGRFGHRVVSANILRTFAAEHGAIF